MPNDFPILQMINNHIRHNGIYYLLGLCGLIGSVVLVQENNIQHMAKDIEDIRTDLTKDISLLRTDLTTAIQQLNRTQNLILKKLIPPRLSGGLVADDSDLEK